MSLSKRIDDFLIGELYSSNTIYTIVSRNEYYDLMFKEDRTKGKVLDWHSDDFLQKKDVKAISIYDDMKLEKELPVNIYDFPNLEYLKVSAHLIKKIDWSYFKNLKALVSEGANLSLKENDTLPNLIHLYLASGTLKFVQKNLPSLKSVGCKYTDTVMEELYTYRQMDNISYSNVNENIFEKIARLGTLKKLDISRGKLSSIDGISKIKGLEFLHLVLLPNLTQLTELEKSISLEVLRINTCKNISNWTFLLELKQLEELVIVGNGDNLPNKIITDKLKNNKVAGIY